MRPGGLNWRAIAVFIPVFALAVLASVYRVPLIFGLSLGVQSIALLLGLRLFGPIKGMLIAVAVGACGYALTGDAGSALLAAFEIAVVGGCLMIRRRSLLPYVALYWATIGSAITIRHYYATFHTVDTELFLLLFKDFVGGITNALLAEVLFFHTPLRRFIHPKQTHAVSFKQILYHVAISAVVLPFLLFVATVGYFQYQDMTDNANKLAANVSASLKNELGSWSPNDLGLLQLHSLIQVSRLDEVVQRFGNGSGVQIVLMNRSGGVLASSIPGFQQDTWDWRSSGEVTQVREGLASWLPRDATPYTLNRWSNGYFVHASEVQGYPIEVIVRVPVSHYLQTLEKVYAVNFGTLLFFILTAVAAGFAISRWVAGDFARLARTTTGLHKQIIQSERIDWPSSGIKELRMLIANFHSLWGRLVDIVQELKQANEQLATQTRKLTKSEERLHDLVYFDPLTGLQNRRYYNEYLHEQMVAQYGSRQSVAVLFMDLDRFKEINDTLGHAAGDDLLRQVAERIAGSSREGTVCRLGGDEFVVVVPQCDRRLTEKVTEAILAAFFEPFRLLGHELYVKSSIGISLYPEDAQDADTITKCADIAMYHAKAAGGNRYAFYAPDMLARTEEKLLLENRLDKALELGQLELAYQPRVDLKTGAVTGVEALLRWNHPERGQLLPERFLPAAEQSGAILDIGAWMIAEACAQLADWQKAGYAFAIGLNVSMQQLLDWRLPLALKEAVARYGLRPEAIEIEIAEHALVGDVQQASRVLEQLRSLGVVLVVDAFGSGGASWPHMIGLPFDRVKLDLARMGASFAPDTRQADWLQAVVGLARGLKLEIGAEGVDDEADLAALAGHDVRYAQGRRFGEAMPKDRLERLLAERAAAGAGTEHADE